MLEPNMKYGYDKKITLCLRGVTGLPMLDLKCEPFNVNLEGVKITTDENGTPTIEGWDEAIFLNEDGSIKEISRPYIGSLNSFDEFIDDRKVLFKVYFPDDEE